MGTCQSRPGSILITGGATGIGLAVTLHFAAQGWNVFCTVLDEAERECLQRAAPGVSALIVDVRDDASLQRAARALAGALANAGLDVLINNAGVATCSPLELTTTAEFQSVFEVNVFGTAAATRTFLPLLRRAAAAEPGRGASPRIIMMSSMLGRIAVPWMPVYAASKYAVEALCDSLRLELEPQGIKVVAIEPGFVKTRLPNTMWRAAKAALEAASPEVRQVYETTFPRGVQIMQGISEHVDTPIAAVVDAINRAANLARPAARYPVDGLTAAYVWVRTRLLTDSMWDAFWPIGEWVQGLMIRRSEQAKARADGRAGKTRRQL